MLLVALYATTTPLLPSAHPVPPFPSTLRSPDLAVINECLDELIQRAKDTRQEDDIEALQQRDYSKVCVVCAWCVMVGGGMARGGAAACCWLPRRGVVLFCLPTSPAQQASEGSRTRVREAGPSPATWLHIPGPPPHTHTLSKHVRTAACVAARATARVRPCCLLVSSTSFLRLLVGNTHQRAAPSLLRPAG